MQVFKIGDEERIAAELFAQGNFTDAEIAEKVGVVRSTLYNWRQQPEFVALVDEFLDRFRREVGRRGLASIDRRVKALNDRWDRMQRVIEARADHPDYADAPGGTTGLLVKTFKAVGNGPAARLVEEFAVDTGLLKELREHEKQAAQELGQWVERSNVDQTTKAYITLGPDDL